MAATLHCMHNTISNVARLTSVVPEDRHQNHESTSILKKIISIYCLTLNKWPPSWILPAMQCHKVFSGHTTLSGQKTPS